MTERAALWLILEHRDGHLDDHALTSSYASMTTATIMQKPTQVQGVLAEYPGVEGEATNNP
jgi:hypothetical protein